MHIRITNQKADDGDSSSGVRLYSKVLLDTELYTHDDHGDFCFFPTSMANGNPLVTSMKHPKLVPSRSVAELGAGFRPVEKVHSPFFCFCFRWSKPNALCLLVITITIVTS